VSSVTSITVQKNTFVYLKGWGSYVLFELYRGGNNRSSCCISKTNIKYFPTVVGTFVDVIHEDKEFTG